MAHGAFCECGCDPPTFSMHPERHHVISRETLKAEGRADLLWDQRNSMVLCPIHHARHTSHFKLIALPMVPESAVEFAVELFGADRAAVELARRYRVEVPEGEHGWCP